MLRLNLGVVALSRKGLPFGSPRQFRKSSDEAIVMARRSERGSYTPPLVPLSPCPSY